jgi:hypothetical protein
MMEALRSFETSVLTRATRRKIQEDSIRNKYFIENKYMDIHYQKFCTPAFLRKAHPYNLRGLGMLRMTWQDFDG